MKLLELFSGTHSVGKVCKELGYEVISVDIDGRADINIDILEWDYTKKHKSQISRKIGSEKSTLLDMRYRIPPNLIRELIN
jgi:hypothetical protein